MGNSSMGPEAMKAFDFMCDECLLVYGLHLRTIGLGVVRDNKTMAPETALVFSHTEEGKTIVLAQWTYAYELHKDGECDCFGCKLEADPDAAIVLAREEFDVNKVTEMEDDMQGEAGNGTVN